MRQFQMVTRIEIADVIEDAFSHPPVTRSDLLAHATAHRARVDILETLSRLPDRSFRSLGELWPHLPGVPADR